MEADVGIDPLEPLNEMKALLTVLTQVLVRRQERKKG